MKICTKCSKPPKKKAEGTALSGKKLAVRMRAEKTGYQIEACGCLGNCKKGPIVVLSDSPKEIKYATVEKILRKLGG